MCHTSMQSPEECIQKHRSGSRTRRSYAPSPITPRRTGSESP